MRTYLTVKELAQCVGLKERDIEARTYTDLYKFVEEFVSNKPIFNVAVLQLFPKPKGCTWYERVNQVQKEADNSKETAAENTETIKTAIFWYKEIVENGYKCPNCNAQIFDNETNNVTDNVYSPPDQMETLYCVNCFYPLATLITDYSSGNGFPRPGLIWFYNTTPSVIEKDYFDTKVPCEKCRWYYKKENFCTSLKITTHPQFICRRGRTPKMKNPPDTLAETNNDASFLYKMYNKRNKSGT